MQFHYATLNISVNPLFYFSEDIICQWSQFCVPCSKLDGLAHSLVERIAGVREGTNGRSRLLKRSAVREGTNVAVERHRDEMLLVT